METILIKQIVNANTVKGNPYWKIETDKGLLTCFDGVVAEKLIVGKYANVEVQISGNYKTIKSFGAIVENPNSVNVEVVKMSDKFAEARSLKNTTMYVSYAKDIFINLMDCKQFDGVQPLIVMEISTNLVKQAIKEFE